MEEWCSDDGVDLSLSSTMEPPSPPPPAWMWGLMTLLLSCGCGWGFSGGAVYQYPKCSSGEQLMELTKGGVQTIGNWTVWGECNLPNPRRDWAGCGRPGPSWICDPDGLLTREAADEVDLLLNRTATSAICRCEDGCHDDGPRHKTVVVVVNWSRVPNLASGRVCEYGCASQVFPQLRPGSRPPFSPELDLMMDRVTDHMLLTWGLNRCDDHVVIFYTKHYGRIQVKAGSIAMSRLRSTVHLALDAATPFFASGDLKGALLTIVRQYSDRLGTSNNTSKVVGIVMTIIVGSIIIFGFVVTVIYCRSEFAQGKDCSQVWAGMVGGEWGILFGGRVRTRQDEKVPATTAELRSLDT